MYNADCSYCFKIQQKEYLMVTFLNNTSCSLSVEEVVLECDVHHSKALSSLVLNNDREGADLL